MTARPRKIAIVGATTLLGKEILDVLSASVFATADLVLMDDEDALGTLEAAGDAVTFVQRIDPSSFAGSDLVFFASGPEITLKHWQQAQRSGAGVVDMTGALEKKHGVALLAPWVQRGPAHGTARHGLDLKTTAVVPAHPSATALALLAKGCQKAASVHSLWATLLLPASEHGKPALTELHQQTVSLLSFQSLPTEIFGAQSAFNTAISFGDSGRVHPAVTEETIRHHYAAIAGDGPPEVALQVVQTPVFHGHAFSIALDLEQAVPLDVLCAALAGEHIEVVAGGLETLSNTGVTGAEKIHLRVRPAVSAPGPSRRFWLWAVADNLRLAASQAVACAIEMDKLHPQGKVQ